MNRVKSLGLSLAQLFALLADNPQASFLQTGINMTSQITACCVRLDDGEGSFEGHGDSFAFQITASSGSAIQ